jgi:alanine racemase
MKKLLTWLSKRRYPYEPLIQVIISKDRLLHNLNEFQRLAPQGQIAPVLKSNAYGHGLLEVATVLEHSKASIPFFIVDSYFEAVALRSNGIKTPLLIIGYSRPETLCNSPLKDAAFTVTSLESLRDIATCERKIRIHLKLDTGMRRQGLLASEIESAIQILKANPSIILEGICSHLSDADNSDPVFTQKQITDWGAAVKQIAQHFSSLKYRHLSATDGHTLQPEIDANVSRLGIGLYGITGNHNLKQTLNLKPALEMKTIITGIKHIKEGEVVGYGKTFTADKDMTIATIPVGYYEGLDRRLSNRGIILAGSERRPCKILGRVSMNITTIDITGMQVEINTPVVVISKNTKDPNSIIEIAQTIDTISYEVAVKIPAHLKRVVV